MPSTAVVHALRVSSLQAFKPQGADGRAAAHALGRKVDRVLLAFDMDADLSGAFNWNVKQLFVYLAATFATPTNVRELAAARRAPPPRCRRRRRRSAPPARYDPPHTFAPCCRS
jgi:hypothetical protein